MGLGAKIVRPPNDGPGLMVSGKWYPGDGMAEVGVSMEADGWEVTLNGMTLHVTKGTDSLSITHHPASLG